MRITTTYLIQYNDNGNIFQLQQSLFQKAIYKILIQILASQAWLKVKFSLFESRQKFKILTILKVSNLKVIKKYLLRVVAEGI